MMEEMMEKLQEEITKLNNKQLYELKEFLDKEIRLSETVISEGMEDDYNDENSNNEKNEVKKC